MDFKDITMIIKELSNYAKKITKKAPCTVVGGKILTSIALRNGQSVFLNEKKVIVSNNVKIQDGDYLLETAPIIVLGGTFEEFAPLVKQNLIAEDIILFLELPFKENPFSPPIFTAKINLHFVGKARSSETSSVSKLEGSYSEYLDKESTYFLSKMQSYTVLGVTENSFFSCEKSRRVELVADSIGINIIAYNGLTLCYDARFLEPQKYGVCFN